MEIIETKDGERIMFIEQLKGEHKDFDALNGKMFEGKTILKAIGEGVDIYEDGLLGWNCILDTAEIKLVPVEWIKEEFEVDRVIMGVD